MGDRSVRAVGPPSAINVRRETDGKRAEAALDYVGEHFHHQRQKIINAVMNAIASSDGLNPQYAVEKWLQLYAIQSLEKSIESDQKKGLAAAKKNAPHHPNLG